MGKTQKPLKITAHLPVYDWEEMKALREQGHKVVPPYQDEGDADVILGPRCWRMDEDHREYLDLAIAEARKLRYPKKEDTKDEE